MLKRLLLALAGILFVALTVLVLAVILLQPAEGPPTRIDFTRFLGEYGDTVAATPARFIATPGEGRLQVECAGTEVQLVVELNGQGVPGADSTIPCGAVVEIPVPLAVENTLSIQRTSPADGAFSVRIKQAADVRLHVLSRVHFNTNVSNFESARAFYGQLGFTTLSGFPDTNTQAMARAIGIQTPTTYDGSKGAWAGGYLLHGELIGLGFMSGAIDLIEFTIPRNEAPPYARLNHLGMARAVLLTADIDADHAQLAAGGVEFLTTPVTRADGTRFAIFKDPDGTFYELAQTGYELAQTGAAAVSATASDRPTRITGFGPLNVNVSDFERSRAWYQMFGFELTQTLANDESPEFARAMGFDAPVRRTAAILTHNVDGSTMELSQWLSPHDPEPAYPIPVNHLGIHRTALATTDIRADVATLQAQGVEFLSPITPCCSGPDASGSIIAFYDPDGTIVELVEQPVMSWFMPVMLWLRDAAGG